MKDCLQTNRISEAGVDVLQIAKTSVLIKIGDITEEYIRQHPAYTLCRAFDALGFRAIYLCGAADYFDVLADLMQESNFVQYPGVWLTKEMANIAPDADVIVDLTNDIEYSSFCAHLSSVKSCPCIFVMWGREWVVVSTTLITTKELRELNTNGGSQQEDIPPPISCIAAGLALQEVLILAGNIQMAAPMEAPVIYNAAAEDRIAGHIDQPWTTDVVENAIVELVGAGGIGVHVLEGLTPMLGNGCELRIFDPDTVGIENLALQSPYTINDVGQPKAIAMAEKLGQISVPNLKIRPMVMSYQERPRSLSKPSVRIVCPDNFEVRKFANDLSTRLDGVPLVEAGSSPLAAKQRTYYPSLTACLEHRIHKLSEKAANEEQPDSCSQSTALTLPGTNMIIGGILATEALKALNLERFGLPTRGTINYDARVSKRFGIIDVLPPCEHHWQVDAKTG